MRTKGISLHQFQRVLIFSLGWSINIVNITTCLWLAHGCKCQPPEVRYSQTLLYRTLRAHRNEFGIMWVRFSKRFFEANQIKRNEKPSTRYILCSIRPSSTVIMHIWDFSRACDSFSGINHWELWLNWSFRLPQRQLVSTAAVFTQCQISPALARSCNIGKENDNTFKWEYTNLAISNMGKNEPPLYQMVFHFPWFDLP